MGHTNCNAAMLQMDVRNIYNTWLRRIEISSAFEGSLKRV